jgi:hypothetical protein
LPASGQLCDNDASGAERRATDQPADPRADALLASGASMEYIQLGEQGDLPGISAYAPFKAVLAIEDGVSRERQQQIARWLVEMGVAYAIICGSDCESWQDSIRQANLEQVPLENMQPEQFVMITAHPHERLRSVFHQARKFARHTHVEIENILTIHVARRNREVEYHNLFNKR